MRIAYDTATAERVSMNIREMGPNVTKLTGARSYPHGRLRTWLGPAIRAT
jgi:hypothetical protein